MGIAGGLGVEVQPWAQGRAQQESARRGLDGGGVGGGWKERRGARSRGAS